jgi:putative ABC transport system substrate-binding protein
MIAISNQWSVVSKSMSSFALCAMLVALCASADAQQPKKVPQIGFLAGVSPPTISARTGAFRQGLRELGYIEGKNIVIEQRYAAGKIEIIPSCSLT